MCIRDSEWTMNDNGTNRILNNGTNGILDRDIVMDDTTENITTCISRLSIGNSSKRRKDNNDKKQYTIVQREPMPKFMKVTFSSVLSELKCHPDNAVPIAVQLMNGHCDSMTFIGSHVVNKYIAKSCAAVSYTHLTLPTTPYV